MELCFDDKPILECTDPVFGLTFECIHTYNHDDELSTSVRMGHWITGALLFLIAGLALYNPLKPSAPHVGQFKTYMNLTVAGYACITALFAITRALWDTGKPLLVGAAIHNLFEWGMMAQVLSTYSAAGARFGKAFVWIWVVISASIMLPLKAAVIAEQSTGVSLDYFVLATFIQMANLAVAKKNLKHVNLFKHATYASLMHFGQIWTLIVGTAFRTSATFGYVVEFLIFLSSGLTFYMYMNWAYEFEEVHQEFVQQQENKEKDPETLGDSSPFFASSVDFGTFLKTWIPSLFMGVFTIIGPGILLPPCADGHSAAVIASVHAPSGPLQVVREGHWNLENWAVMDGYHTESTAMNGMTHYVAKPGAADAMEDVLRQLVAGSRQEDGCLLYYFTKDMRKEGHFYFFEKWTSQETLMKHIQHGIPSTLLDDYFRGLQQSVDMFGPQAQVEPVALDAKQPLVERHLGFSVTIPATYDEVWSRVSNWADYRWVQGIQAVYIVPGTKLPTRILQLGNSATIEVTRVLFQENDEAMTQAMGGQTSMFEYNIVSPFPGTQKGSYYGRLYVTKRGEQTEAQYFARFTPMGDKQQADATTQHVKEDFEQHRLPYIAKAEWMHAPLHQLEQDPRH